MVNCVVIDDDKDVVNVFCELLNMIGLDVLATGADDMKAVELYEKFSPDIIFVDLIMPRYDGFYAIQNIRRIDPNAKIIVVTGDLNADECDLLDLHKVTAVVYRPFDIHKVKQCITDVFLD